MAEKVKRSVVYEINAKDNASKEFKNIHQNAQSSLGGISGIASSAGTALLGLGAAAGTGAVAIGGFAIKAGDEIEKGLLKFETLLGSAEEAQVRMDELTSFAAKTPFQLDDITKADVMLQGFGIRTEKLLGTIGDAAAISGSGISDLSLIFGQLSQDKSLENIRQLVDRGVVSFTELEEAGIKFAKDRSIINSVEETYGAVVGIVEEKFSGGMEKLSGTVSGKVSTLKDTFTLALADLSNESGLGDFAKDFLDFAIDKLPSALMIAKESIGEVATTVKEFTDPFIQEIPAIIENVKLFFTENEEAITDTLESIQDTFQSTIDIVTGIIGMLRDAWDNDFLFMATGTKALLASVVYFGTVAAEIFGGVIDTIAILATNYEYYWNSMKLSLYEFVNDTVDAVDSWAKAILSPINAVRDAMGFEAITVDYSGAKIDTTYEKAVVSQFKPEETIGGAWEKRMENINSAAERFIETGAELISERTRRTEEEKAAKEVVINNYYNNQLNDELSVDKMVTKADIKQRSQLQSYGVNVI